VFAWFTALLGLWGFTRGGMRAEPGIVLTSLNQFWVWVLHQNPKKVGGASMTGGSIGGNYEGGRGGRGVSLALGCI
jgi:hypothetical protein